MQRIARQFKFRPLQLLSRGIKTDINSVKRGNIVLLNKRLLLVQSITQRSQARAGAHYKLEYKDLKTGAKALERVNSGSFVDVVELQTKKLQFLYCDEMLHLMDPESFEEFEVSKDLINAPSGSKAIPFLTTDSNLVVEYYENEPISVKVPERAEMNVVETGASRGSTESAMTKMIKLENGVEILAPDFISVGDRVVVDIHNIQYHSRV